MGTEWRRPSTPQTGSWLCPFINMGSTSLEPETSGWASAKHSVVWSSREWNGRKEEKYSYNIVYVWKKVMLVGCHSALPLIVQGYSDHLVMALFLSTHPPQSLYIGYWRWEREILRCQLPPAWWHRRWVIRTNLQACESDSVIMNMTMLFT